MGLFGSSNKATSESKQIRPTIIRTENVAKELMQIGKSNKVSPNTLDFNLLEVETYTRVCELDKDDVDWEEMAQEDMHGLDDASAILNPLFQIKQVYEIEVFSKNYEEDLFKDFHAAVGANATKCKIYLSIKAGSKLTYFKGFKEAFLNYINKSKVRAGVLVYIFDEMVADYITKLSAQVKVEGTLVYETPETVLIANAHEPTPTVDDALIIHYEKSNEIGENDRVNHSERGFIHSVSENDILIEYIKPMIGKAGRNCRGEFMEPKEPEISNEPTFSVDDTIEQVDNKDNIEYRAKSSGYITLEGTTYQIKSDMEIGTIDFKTTGNISAGVDSDVVLNVKESDSQKDAIGSGMEVEVSEIDIKGNIGPDAKVTARRISIEGQTHKTSEVKADDLTISVHKGLALGKNVKISRLEQGVVRCDKAMIDQSTGGEIYAKEIKIEHCGSYVKATASRLIDIKKLQGNENVFVINPLVQTEKQEGLKGNKAEIEELKKSLAEIQKEIDKYSKMVRANTAGFNDIKKKLIHNKKNGIKSPEAFVNKYKQFNKISEHLENIKKEHAIKNDKFQLLTTKTASFQDNILDARVINRDRWIGHNEIVFQLVDPPAKIVYSVPEGSPTKVFGLVDTDEGYQIQALKDDVIYSNYDDDNADDTDEVEEV